MINRNIFNANPAAYYQAFRMAVPNYPDVGVEEFQKIIQEETQKAADNNTIDLKLPKLKKK